MVLLFPKLDEDGSAASFCKASFLGLAIDFLMIYRLWCYSRLRGLPCWDPKVLYLRNRNVGEELLAFDPAQIFLMKVRAKPCYAACRH